MSGVGSIPCLPRKNLKQKTMKKTEKLSVANYIYDNYNERGSKAFEKKVTKILKDNGIKGEVICHGSFMRKIGSGYYTKCAEIEINGEIFLLNSHTHDSCLYDNWYEPTSKERRNLFLAVLEEVKLKECLAD